MRVFFLLLIFLLFFQHAVYSQSPKYWVYFKDKPSTQIYLSARALERRIHQKIPLDIRDYSVSEQYLSTLEDLGLKIEKKSRWLNAVTLYADYASLQKVQVLPFVIKVEPVKKWKLSKPIVTTQSKTSIDYGNSYAQNTMINIQYLHDKGYKGSGKLIGIFDSGFINANQHNVFRHIYDENRLIATYNFVNNTTNVYDLDGHGTNVWSCIGAYLPDTLVGTGFGAQFLLAVTEDVGSETTVEEDNWLAALEWADSIGVDIINTSLGYNIMDDGLHYTYADMDGNTTIISRAADIAASKGIICVISAGNEGNSAWKKITAPCDADSVLCVGSVNNNRLRSSFSSIGPTFDGRIKPDVMAMGGAVSFASTNLGFTLGNGTSFSAPIITGLVACLWQANPTKTNLEIMDAIKRSSDRASNPDTLYGWGIPDAARADSLLKGFTISKQKNNVLKLVKIYPNPAKEKLFFLNIPPQTQLSVYDLCGKLIFHNDLITNELDIINFPKGWLFLRLQFQEECIIQKVWIE